MRGRRRLPSLALALLLASAGALPGQGLSSAAIAGRVQDASGTPLPSAALEVRQSATGEMWRPRLSSDGRFVLEHVSPGPYRIVARAIGFQPLVLEGILLRAGDRHEAVITLQPGPATLPLIQATTTGSPREDHSAGLRRVLSPEEIRHLPNVQRNLINLLVPSPVVRTDLGGWNGALAAFQLDGGQGTDLYAGTHAGAPIFGAALPVDAIAEVATLAPPYDARWGQVFSGVFAISSLRGTNTWRRSLQVVFQNEDFVARPAASTATDAPFANWSLGAILAGPLIRDRLHIAAVADYTRFERRDTGPFVTDTTGGADVARTGVSLESATRFHRILRERWGLAAGTLGASNTVRPRWDLWARASLLVGRAGVVELTQRVARGTEAGTLGPAGTRPSLPAPYLTGSIAREDRRSILETRLIWRVQPAGRWSNELVAGWRRLRDDCAPAGGFPRVLVAVDQGLLAAGADSTCTTTHIRQTSFEVSGHASILLGRHLVTAGLHAEWFQVDDPVLVGSQGLWQFASLDSLEAGVAQRYERVRPGPLAPDGPSTTFRVHSVGFYAQDRIRIGERFVLTAGLRVDRPTLPDPGRTNPAVLVGLGLDTGAPPDPVFLLGPRIGLTWDVRERGAVQLRAGAGLFTGRPPYRWYSGIQRGSGGEQTLLLCQGTQTPPFDPRQQPDVCGDGGRPIGQISAYAPDLRFPRTAQASIGVSAGLAAGIGLAADLVYGRALNTFRYRDANLTAPIGAATGEANRPLYGGLSPSGTAQPSRRIPELGPVVLVDGGHGDRAISASLILSRPLRGRWSAEAGYVWTRSEDRQSITTFDPLLSLGGTPLVGTHDQRERATSLFGAPHRVHALAALRLPLRTTVSLLYVANPGRPFSWVVDGDANGDGIGRPATGFNDLIYVPQDVRPGGDIRLVMAPDNAPADAATYATLDSLIEAHGCLRNRRGRLAERNGCRNGWTMFLNARLNIDLPFAGTRGMDLGLDVYNVLNLLHGTWGQTRETARGPVVRLLRLVGWDGAEGRGIYRLNTPPTAQVNEALSRWRLQLSARYRY